jgi:Flp pilus assembly protein TadG
MSLVRRLACGRGGSAAVETALVLPLLLLMVMGAIEFGRLGWTRAGLNYAVQEAARCAAVQPGVCGTPTQTAAFAAQRVAALGVPASAFTVTTEACGARVSVAFQYQAVAWRVFGVSPTLRAQICRA